MKKDLKQETLAGQSEQLGTFRAPVEKRWKCQNHMLESISEMKNLHVNGEKDSQYNDLIQFEDLFNNWDQRAILLTQWNWERKYKEPYVYIAPIGIYTHIGLFARKLQRVLDYEANQISVIMIGEDLHITVYPEKDNYDRSTTFEAKILHLDQIDDGFHHDGWKFDLPETVVPKQKIEADDAK